MINDKFILDDAGNVVPEPDLLKWAAWFENTAARIVAQTMVGDIKVSTVFLGLDHRFFGDGPPVLWETMIFGGKHNGWQDRYTSREDAEIGHLAAIELAKEGV